MGPDFVLRSNIIVSSLHMHHIQRVIVKVTLTMNTLTRTRTLMMSR